MSPVAKQKGPETRQLRSGASYRSPEPATRSSSDSSDDDTNVASSGLTAEELAQLHRLQAKAAKSQQTGQSGDDQTTSGKASPRHSGSEAAADEGKEAVGWGSDVDREIPVKDTEDPVVVQPYGQEPMDTQDEEDKTSKVGIVSTLESF